MVMDGDGFMMMDGGGPLPLLLVYYHYYLIIMIIICCVLGSLFKGSQVLESGSFTSSRIRLRKKMLLVLDGQCVRLVPTTGHLSNAKHLHGLCG